MKAKLVEPVVASVTVIDVEPDQIQTPAQAEEEEKAENVNDPALASLRNVIDAMSQGKDLMHHSAEIERLVMGQETRASLVDSLLLAHDYVRIADFAETRRRLEVELMDSLKKHALTAPEKLALLTYLNSQTKDIEGKIKASSPALKDVMTLLVSLDQATAVHEKQISLQLANTTPQGREIVRRVAHRLSKAGKVAKQ